MKRYILTGAPGAGKTAILRALERWGFPVIEEAATDVHALDQASGRPEPWTSPHFLDDILALQSAREHGTSALSSDVQVFDRSPVCTLALARHLGFPPSEDLRRELERIQREEVYDQRVFLVEGLGFIVNTEVRRIDLEEAEAFGRLHEQVYGELGYELVRIAPGAVGDRAAAVADRISAWSGKGG